MNDAAPSTGAGGHPRWLVFPMLAAYLTIVIALFSFWVQPSLTGENNHHITADSTTYLYFADALREGRVDAYVATSLFIFPNTLWGAVSLALLVPDTFNEMLLNLVIFSVSLWLFSRAVELDPALFLLLLVLNPTTTISLTAVNKELLDFLALSLFFYFLRHRNRALLALALLISLVSRFETFVTISVFLFLRSGWNPLRGRRWQSLLAYCLVVDVLVSLVLRLPSMAVRLEEAQFTSGFSGGTSLLLNRFEQNFLFILVVIPKILQNLFGEALNVPHWFLFSMEDPANTFIVFGNNVANMVIVLLLVLQRRLTLRSSIIYYAAVVALTMSIALIIQPRYFYGMYVLLCLEAARRVPASQLQLYPECAHAAS